MRVEVQTRPADDMLPDEDELPMMEAHHIDALTGEDELAEGPLLTVTPGKTAGKMDPKKPDTWGKVSRNDPCPCGSGKKYKHCHGAYV
jgi:preprotein translocase subunit SecA